MGRLFQRVGKGDGGGQHVKGSDAFFFIPRKEYFPRIFFNFSNSSAILDCKWWHSLWLGDNIKPKLCSNCGTLTEAAQLWSVTPSDFVLTSLHASFEKLIIRSLKTTQFVLESDLSLHNGWFVLLLYSWDALPHIFTIIARVMMIEVRNLTTKWHVWTGIKYQCETSLIIIIKHLIT